MGRLIAAGNLMLLERIKSPSDLKLLSLQEMEELAANLREVIIERVSLNGGHLASNLGVAELTLALHSVFDSPVDKILWDVGHQSYPHKLLTGRHRDFPRLRKYGGISGFPKPEESEHDAFGTGHSSTSISAALGIVEARDIKKERFKVVVVIGDGAMSGGLALEGLNNAGHLKKDLIVVLNDNEMSISPNVGALSAYLNRILTGSFYRKFKDQTKSFLRGIPKVGGPMAKMAHRIEELLKSCFLPGVIFEELGFNYFGPIDGHDIGLLIKTLRGVKNASSPTLVHVITRKGKGYSFSEEDPSGFHGIGPFEPGTGTPVGAKALTYSEVFGKTLAEFAGRDERIIAITAAMKEGTGLARFSEKYPDRFYDVGIAESHAVTFAAGLATQGLKPVVAVYSTFLQRAYDQIIHDVCLQRLPVVFAIDRAGIVGEDGPTHNGLFDLSYLRQIPNLVVMAPKDSAELEVMLDLALKHDGPVAIRYPREKVTSSSLDRPGNGKRPLPSFTIGEAEIIMEGTDLAFVALGNTVGPALSAAEALAQKGISAMVINARFIKPFDQDLFLALATRIKKIITVEENALMGGFGSALLEFFSEADVQGVAVRRLGIPDEFVEQGGQAELRKKYLLDKEGIYRAALQFLRERSHAEVEQP